MPRLSMTILVPTAILATFAVGSTIAWSNNVNLKGDRAVVRPNSAVQAVAAIPDFDAVFATRTRKADRETKPRAEVKVDFAQVFADVSAAPRRTNTPSNREKLRNAGWSRIKTTDE